jgi:cellobiose transport system substrate-binding protein
MANGDFAALGCPAWMMNYIQGQAPDTAGKWNITSIPEVGGNWGGTQLTIPAASDQHQAAYDMITWLLSPENQLEVFKLHGNFPSTPELYDTPEIQEFTNDFFSGAPVGKIYAESAKAVQPIYEGAQQREIDREFENALIAVEDGNVAAADAWTTALANVALAIQG